MALRKENKCYSCKEKGGFNQIGRQISFLIRSSSGGNYHWTVSPSFHASSQPRHLLEPSFRIDDVSFDPGADLWACGPPVGRLLAIRHQGHNAFSPVSQALIVIQVPQPSRGEVSDGTATLACPEDRSLTWANKMLINKEKYTASTDPAQI